MCNPYYFSTATILTWTRLYFTLYEHCQSCLFQQYVKEIILWHVNIFFLNFIHFSIIFNSKIFLILLKLHFIIQIRLTILQVDWSCFHWDMALFCYARFGALNEQFCHANPCSVYTKPRLELLMRNVYLHFVFFRDMQLCEDRSTIGVTMN